MSQEVWDWADAFSKHVHALDQEMREAASKRDREAERCGNCYWWMKSRDCPREHNVNGMSRGPSSGAPGCEKFLHKDRVLASPKATP